MHLISALAAGISGAESGTVEFYVRGGSTPASWWQDFEGTSAGPVGTATLDARGSVNAYVNQFVRCVVKNQGGSIVTEFTVGSSAPDVEIRSNSITGNAYSGGASAPGNPSNLKLWADAWVASAGAPDFKVLFGGVATNLTSIAIAAAALRYFVVTDPVYGATGNGVTNDLAAVQAAINAANAATNGGVVVFPRGTYLINGTLTGYQTVALLGQGAAQSRILVQSASANLFTGASVSRIQDLGITFSAANFTGTLFNVTSGSALQMSDVAVTGGVISGTFLAASAFCQLTLNRCDVTTRGAGVVMTAASGTFIARDSSIGANDVLNALSGSACVATQVIAVSGCSLYAEGASGSKVILEASMSIRASYNYVSGFSGGTCTVFDCDAIQEVGTLGRLGTTAITYYSLSSGIASQACYLGSRDVGRSLDQTNNDPLTVRSLQHRSCTIRTTSAAGWTGNCQLVLEQAPHGSDLLLMVWNDTAAPLTYEWSTNVSIAGGTTFAVAANSVRSFLLASTMTNSNPEWFLVADLAGAEVVE